MEWVGNGPKIGTYFCASAKVATPATIGYSRPVKYRWYLSARAVRAYAALGCMRDLLALDPALNAQEASRTSGDVQALGPWKTSPKSWFTGCPLAKSVSPKTALYISSRHALDTHRRRDYTPVPPVGVAHTRKPREAPSLDVTGC